MNPAPMQSNSAAAGGRDRTRRRRQKQNDRDVLMLKHELHWGRLSAQQVSSPRQWALSAPSSIRMNHIGPSSPRASLHTRRAHWITSGCEPISFIVSECSHVMQPTRSGRWSPADTLDLSLHITELYWCSMEHFMNRVSVLLWACTEMLTAAFSMNQ